MHRESKNFFSSAYKRKIHPNRTPFRSKMSRSLFCPPTYPLRMNEPFWRRKCEISQLFSSHFTTEEIKVVLAKKSKTFSNFPFIDPSGQEWAYWPKTFEKYVSHYLATAEGIFCRGKRKKSKKNKPSRRKNL